MSTTSAIVWSTFGWISGLLNCRAVSAWHTYRTARSFSVSRARAAWASTTWILMGWASYPITNGKSEKRCEFLESRAISLDDYNALNRAKGIKPTVPMPRDSQ